MGTTTNDYALLRKRCAKMGQIVQRSLPFLLPNPDGSAQDTYRSELEIQHEHLKISNRYSRSLTIQKPPWSNSSADSVKHQQIEERQRMLKHWKLDLEAELAAARAKKLELLKPKSKLKPDLAMKVAKELAKSKKLPDIQGKKPKSTHAMKIGMFRKRMHSKLVRR
jgi:hypothetical protein